MSLKLELRHLEHNPITQKLLEQEQALQILINSNYLTVNSLILLTAAQLEEKNISLQAQAVVTAFIKEEKTRRYKGISQNRFSIILFNSFTSNQLTTILSNIEGMDHQKYELHYSQVQNIKTTENIVKDIVSLGKLPELYNQMIKIIPDILDL